MTSNNVTKLDSLPADDRQAIITERAKRYLRMESDLYDLVAWLDLLWLKCHEELPRGADLLAYEAYRCAQNLQDVWDGKPKKG